MLESSSCYESLLKRGFIGLEPKRVNLQEPPRTPNAKDVPIGKSLVSGLIRSFHGGLGGVFGPKA